jgi:hypothetical protein
MEYNMFHQICGVRLQPFTADWLWGVGYASELDGLAAARAGSGYRGGDCRTMGAGEAAARVSSPHRNADLCANTNPYADDHGHAHTNSNAHYHTHAHAELR